jgi:hypothetical protein
LDENNPHENLTKEFPWGQLLRMRVCERKKPSDIQICIKTKKSKLWVKK